MKTIPFTVASKKNNKIPGSKFNKWCEWILQGELQTPKERDQGRLTEGGKISHAHGLVEST
jgi:hypothetical protein